ncbi:hypothetical protein Fmac_028439 [Flemingia macrophylla]|uniref:Secreted protein n=1 Tax=Flemingia macrophylla TaxID=520843 RepID=A0ABD1L7H6_9FABA
MRRQKARGRAGEMLFIIVLVIAAKSSSPHGQEFKEAPEFYNSGECARIKEKKRESLECSEEAIQVTMTLDRAYIRGSMAAILSVLQHSSCPYNIFFHLVCSSSFSSSLLRATISNTLPYLKFNLCTFNDSHVSVS